MNLKKLIKEKILMCLTEDFKNNQAIFDKKEGWQVFAGTDLEMVMNKVVKGITFAFDEYDKSTSTSKTKSKEKKQ